jgi:hypothetical protein
LELKLTRPGQYTHIDITAYHEAGHAIAAISSGRYVQGVFVSYDHPGNGLTISKKCRFENPFSPQTSSGSALAAWELTLAHVKTEMKISMAGPLAEAKLLGKPLRSIGAEHDLIYCEGLADRLDDVRNYNYQQYGISTTPGYQVMNDVRKSTRRWIARPKTWDLIGLVARKVGFVGDIDDADIFELLGISMRIKHQGILALKI